jgi:Subtilisin-like serine proteases
MCDIVAGTLIISHATVDPAGAAVVPDIKEGKIEDVSYLGSLRERLHKLELEIDANFPFDYHLVRVPADSEAWKSNYLQFFYKIKLLDSLELLASSEPFLEAVSRSSRQFTVTPNHVLSLASPKGKGTTVKAASFAFDPVHGVYRDMIGMTAPSSTGAGVRIAILDSGIAVDHPIAPVEQRNFVDPSAPWQVDDDHGHGTVVALIIRDLVPDAEYIIYKIADYTGRVSEWDALAAVAAASVSADVAAAGNAGNPALAYPARFGQVAAIGAITSAYVLSDESNFGDTDHHAAPPSEPLRDAGRQRRTLGQRKRRVVCGNDRRVARDVDRRGVCNGSGSEPVLVRGRRKPRRVLRASARPRLRRHDALCPVRPRQVRPGRREGLSRRRRSSTRKRARAWTSGLDGPRREQNDRAFARASRHGRCAVTGGGGVARAGPSAWRPRRGVGGAGGAARARARGVRCAGRRLARRTRWRVRNWSCHDARQCPRRRLRRRSR